MFRNNWLAFVFGALGHPKALLHPELRTRARLVFAPKRKTRSDQPVNHVAFAQLGFLAVRQDCRGTGLPESLLLRTITESKKRKWPRLGAGVYRTNLPARFMYAKLGFQENKSLGTDHLVFVELDLNKFDIGS